MREAIVGRWLLGMVLGLTLAVSAAGQGAPSFPTGSISLVTEDGDEHAFTVELARTREQIEWGLMYRRSLAQDHGMLFIYPDVRHVTMWMKNTKIPLDMLFLDAGGEVVRIVERAEPESTKSIPSGEPVRAVLEVAGGTAERLDLEPGAEVRHPVFD